MDESVNLRTEEYLKKQHRCARTWAYVRQYSVQPVVVIL